jgi:hypothetical protein
VNRKGFFVLGLFVAGCATQAVRTPQQAKTIALSSVCAKLEVILDPGETMPTEWLAERRGDRWYVWLPSGPGTRLPIERGHMGAWVNAKDGKILYCERGGKQREPPSG